MTTPLTLASRPPTAQALQDALLDASGHSALQKFATDPQTELLHIQATANGARERASLATDAPHSPAPLLHGV